MSLAVSWGLSPQADNVSVPTARTYADVLNGNDDVRRNFGQQASQALYDVGTPVPPNIDPNPTWASRVWPQSQLWLLLPIRLVNTSDNPLASGDQTQVTVVLESGASGTWQPVQTQTYSFSYPAQAPGSDRGLVRRWSGLVAGALYRVKITGTYTRAGSSLPFAAFNARMVTFVGERDPLAPTITAPLPNTSYQFESGAPGEVDLVWESNDPDVTGYNGWQVSYRPSPTPSNPDPPWVIGADYMPAGVQPLDNRGDLTPLEEAVWEKSCTLKALGLPVGGLEVTSPGAYQFRVRTRDMRAVVYDEVTPPAFQSFRGLNKGVASAWSAPVTLIWTAPYLPPVPLSPIGDSAQSTETVNFVWEFRDPRATGGAQNRREVQIRAAGTETWFQVIPSGDQASATQNYTWTVEGSGFTLEPGTRYEWQARTRSTPGNHVSTWSESAFFWAVPDPGSGAEIPLPDLTVPDSGLGVGNNRVFVFDRGGVMQRGELKHKTLVRWHRKRDDLSSLTVWISGWDDQDIGLLKTIRSWMHELVVYREVDGQKTKRVWEGPVTRITYGSDYVEFEAHDVLAYVYRRILRQGWNDSYRAGGGGLTPITVRAANIIQNALAYDDPNVLAYLQARVASDDSRQSRVVYDFSSSAFEALDSLAATAGLDYTAAGRRIIVWDTHNQLGILPEMRNGDFDNDILITEYGMRLATTYAISNNQGVYGVAERSKAEYGYIEMVDSAYGETDAGGVEETLTEEARLELIQTLTGQAERSIASRYPAPLLARVPDNSRIMPDVQVGINQLIPGVFIPLRADHPIRPVTQKQKLDSVTVEQIGSEETVRIVLSPAPRDRDDDPDSASVV